MGLAARSAVRRQEAVLALAVAALGVLAVASCRRDGPPHDLSSVAGLSDLLPAAETACAGEAAPQGDGDRVFLPAGCRLDLYLRLPPGAWLTWEDLRGRGAAAELWMEVAPAAGEPSRASVALPSRPGGLALPAGGGITRVRLAVEAGEGAGGRGVWITEGRVAAPREGLAQVSRPPIPLPEGPSVLVYLVDTLRADRVAPYGAPAALTPHLAAFAEEATTFTGATAQSSWTRTSVASLFTGQLPPRHGVWGRRDRLAEAQITLAEVFAAAGYDTVAFVANPNVDDRYGMGQGFATYRTLWKKRQAREAEQALLDWLDAREGDRPFFAYLHTIEPHGPYQPPEPYRSRWAADVPEHVGSRRHLRRLFREPELVTPELLGQLRAVYDAEVAWGDDGFGRLVAGLRERGLWDETVVAFLSDHGEELYEHGRWEHGKALYAESVDIPLLLRVPGLGEGRQVEDPVQHTDVAATVLAAAGLEAPASFSGRDLLPLVAGAAPDPERPVASFLDLDRFTAGAVTTARWRWVEMEVEGRPPTSALYDRRADPKETRDVAAEHPIMAGYLGSVLRLARQAPATAGGEGVADEALDAETLEQLRALGYVE